MMKRPHLQPVVDMVSRAECREPGSPWRRVADHRIGGLQAVGFGEGVEQVIVVSSEGRGVFDCLSGERVARDRNDDDAYDPVGLVAQGLGSLQGQSVRMSGCHGGGLPTSTVDGWAVERLTLEWPIESLLLVPPGSWIYWVLQNRPHEFTKVLEDSEVRAWGFSPSGRTLLLAISDGFTIYGRDQA